MDLSIDDDNNTTSNIPSKQRDTSLPPLDMMKFEQNLHELPPTEPSPVNRKTQEKPLAPPQMSHMSSKAGINNIDDELNDLDKKINQTLNDISRISNGTSTAANDSFQYSKPSGKPKAPLRRYPGQGFTRPQPKDSHNGYAMESDEASSVNRSDISNGYLSPIDRNISLSNAKSNANSKQKMKPPMGGRTDYLNIKDVFKQYSKNDESIDKDRPEIHNNRAIHIDDRGESRLYHEKSHSTNARSENQNEDKKGKKQLEEIQKKIEKIESFRSQLTERTEMKRKLDNIRKDQKGYDMRMENTSSRAETMSISEKNTQDRSMRKIHGETEDERDRSPDTNKLSLNPKPFETDRYEDEKPVIDKNKVKNYLKYFE